MSNEEILLINTIEIEPFHFTQNEYVSPKKSKKESPLEWQDYWYRCITDSGLQNLNPVESGSYFVDINTIGDTELKIIIQHELQNIDLAEFEDQTGCMIGGIIIIKDGKIILNPNCCGDLSDLDNWEVIPQKEINKWEHLWLGHPWIFYKRTGKNVEFSEYTDLNLIDFHNISPKHIIPEHLLVSQLNQMRLIQNTFEQRVSKILLELDIEHHNKIAKLLTGNRD